MACGHYLGCNRSTDERFLRHAPDGVLCKACGTCLDLSYVPHELRDTARRSKLDLIYTHDLRYLYSEHFPEFLREHSSTGFEASFMQGCGRYYIVPRTIVRFDSDRCQTRFHDKCDLCGGYESIVGATPAYLKEQNLDVRGIYRTDLHFASGAEKHFLTIVGVELASLMKKMRFTGVYFDDAFCMQA